MAVVGWSLFILGLFVGLVVIPFGLAGTFIILLSAFFFAWISDFSTITWPFLAILLSIAIGAELVEFLLGALAARKHGSSSWGIWGSIVGGFLGAVWGTALSPIIGTIFGAFIGAFIGAFLFEYARFRDSQKAFNAGWGAFLGTAAGRIFKLVVAIAMIVMIGYRVI